ncbi:zinc finger CCCH domain-containing protein [Klebsormidium nitens]|uniref:Zinc finger CCCH domain-containing protein n=1 Tax=Klebsormidium nitens TaxID=105231 RepID=A0A1Y1HMJ1_KLENI|nr:zinc finger CCCH domain-containing protein [Klebsormidium nitens]|eukprot:GAQ79223.1 zinc finger CCCH domain-containing protein [Klebsormidium nitens]
MMMFEEPMAYPSASDASRYHALRLEENRDQQGRNIASPRQVSSLQNYAADLMAAAAAIQAHRDSSKYLDAEVERAMSAFGPRKDTDDEQWGHEKGEGGLDIYSCDQFRMYEFKVRRCMRGRSHDWTECPFAHPGEKARRRDPRKYHYSGTACPDFRKGTCRRGDACEFAHGVFECWLHPARYHTQPCKDGLKCRRRVCFFAHTPEQLRLLPAAAAAANHADKPHQKQGSPTKRQMTPDNAYSPIQPGSPASAQPYYNSNPSLGGGQQVPPMSPLGHTAPFSPRQSYRASNYPNNQMPPRSQAPTGTPRLERPSSLPPRLQLPSIEEQIQQAQLAAALVAASQSPASSPIPISGGSGRHYDESQQRMAEILAAHLCQLEIRGASTPGANWPQYPPPSPQSQRSSMDLPPSQRSSFDMGGFSQRSSFDLGYSDNRGGSIDLRSSHRESMDYGSRRSSFDYANFQMNSPAVRRTISVPASPATRQSNPWEAANEAEFQLPQRVESGKDLRAAIYGRLGANGQGRSEGGNSRICSG